jgi:hypothetical protein
MQVFMVDSGEEQRSFLVASRNKSFVVQCKVRPMLTTHLHSFRYVGDIQPQNDVMLCMSPDFKSWISYFCVWLWVVQDIVEKKDWLAALSSCFTDMDKSPVYRYHHTDRHTSWATSTLFLCVHL